MQKFMSICKFEESTTGKCRGKGFQKHLIRLAASDKGSCFEQEKLLALDEEDVCKHYLLGAFTIQSGDSNEIINRYHILWVSFRWFTSGLFHCLWHL